MRDIPLIDIIERPVPLIYKNVPYWVVNTLDRNKNCIVRKSLYFKMINDLEEYYKEKAEIKREIGSIQSEGGGYYLWVK